MGSDLFALSALANELNTALKGARIDKIQQPETDELRFYLRTGGKSRILVISCNAAAPRLHLTDFKKQSPKTAPNLCMLLRKHLSSASVESVSIYNADRIIQIKFSAKTEMRDDTEYYIFVELINRYSNIVFTDKNLVILDAVKHLPLDIARDHVVLRGVKYDPVGQRKISYLNVSNDVFDNFYGGDLHKYVLDNISGFSGQTVTELLHRAGLLSAQDGFDADKKRRLLDTIESFKNLPSEAIQPCIINSKDVYPIVYSTLSHESVQSFPTMSEAYDALFTDCDKDIRNKARLKSLSTAAKRLYTKVEKNIANDLERLHECSDMEKYRIYGELIVSNIYRIKKGDEVLRCTNYYDNSEVEIALDARLTPSKNSAAYYNRYNKLKRTKEFVSKKLVADKELLEYVLSIQDEIENLPYGSDPTPIREELESVGGGRRTSSKGKIRKEKAEPPYIYNVDGFYIYRGKNNMQNDEITFKMASSGDTWLHLKNEHGAHTVISAEGRDIPDRVLKIAAEITASTKSASAEVDYTLRKNVKRHPNGHLAQVIYTNFKTVLAKPDAHTEFLIKQ